MKYFVTADTHYGHGKIIEYANRPFKDNDDMNAGLIKRFNERVKPDDTTFFLGDFCFKSGLHCNKSDFWLKQLNGNKIMVRGNHDNNNSTKTIIDCIHVTFAGQRINMVHKPEHFNPFFNINLVGHVHQAWRFKEEAGSVLLNVGVDVQKYYPITLDEAISQVIKYKKGLLK